VVNVSINAEVQQVAEIVTTLAMAVAQLLQYRQAVLPHYFMCPYQDLTIDRPFAVLAFKREVL